MKYIVVVGARPNFVKAAPVIRELVRDEHDVKVVHTGQHYDEAMSGSFLKDLGIEPSCNLGVSAPYRPHRVGTITKEVGTLCAGGHFDAGIVVGDTDSTLGGAMGIKLSGTPLVHLEAGLRSRNWEMPEEMNRYVVDHMSDLLLVTCPEGITNLEDEKAPGKVFPCGNTMIDSLVRIRGRTASEDAAVLQKHRVRRDGFAVATFHRPSLVDHPERVDALFEQLTELSAWCPIVVPAHPRLKLKGCPNLSVCKPLPYPEFLALVANSLYCITDSGGLQEETTFLGVPCYTFRSETERWVTVGRGTNDVVGTDPELLKRRVEFDIKHRQFKQPRDPVPLWDGHAGKRAARAVEHFSGQHA